MKKLETDRRWISLARSGMDFFKKITEGLEVPNEIIDPTHSVIFNSVFFDQMLFNHFKSLGFSVSPDKAISFNYSTRDGWRRGGAFFSINLLKMMTLEEFEEFNSKKTKMEKRFYRFLKTIVHINYVWDKKTGIFRSIRLGDNMSISLDPSDKSGVNIEAIKEFCLRVTEAIEKDVPVAVEDFRTILKS